jgi:isoleucyl-tRNA synthetase
MKAAREGEWTQLADGKVTVGGHTLVDDEFTLALNAKEGVVASALKGNDAVVSLDIEVTDDLRDEGTARDLVRQIQDARRDRDLNIDDRIELRLHLPSEVQTAVRSHEAYLTEQVLATETSHVDSAAGLAHTGTLEGVEIAFDFSVA